MKKRKSLILALASLLLIAMGCKKDDVVQTDKEVGISRITYYPTFTLSGDAVVSIVKGNAFTDPGATASAGGADVPVTAAGAVDANTVGMYTINYTATNEDGFSGSASRLVFVLDEAEHDGVDLSGTYAAVSASAGTAQISKVAPGVYYTTNCWNGATTIPIYFTCTDGATVNVPLQPTGFGDIVTPNPGSYSNGLISWDLYLVAFDLLRTRPWQKQ